MSLEQILAFDWKVGAQIELSSPLLKQALAQALKKRQQILDLALNEQQELDPAKRKEELLRDAEEALLPLRRAADACVGAFFAGDSDKTREKERIRRRDLIATSLANDGVVAEFEAPAHCFHWPLEFPEIFHGQRPDPLDKEQVNREAWMDAFVGNPPFLGGSSVSSNFGEAHLAWLLELHEGSHGNADLSAHFFRRAFDLLGAHGTLGLIATNTIAQGDTRSTGLHAVTTRGGEIYDAVKSMKWPVDGANVSVSVVQIAKGSISRLGLDRRLDGVSAGAINSRLRPSVERPDPVVLEASRGFSFSGTKVYGAGFVLSRQQRDDLIQQSQRNAQRISRYTGGEEINGDPDPALERYVINFAEMELAEAERWPDLLELVRKLVKPERDKVKRAHTRDRWWLFEHYRSELYAAIGPLKRALALSTHSKHLALDWVTTDRVFSHACFVFPVEHDRWLATLQSRVHEVWARLLSSSLEDRLRYAPSDCFETFPFPEEQAFSGLDAIGKKLHETRAAYLKAEQVGLTTTYNRLKDESETSAPIRALRTLHQEVDRAVLDAYGWKDIAVPPYCAPPAAAWTTFEDQVLDRLFALNATRAAEEARSGLTARAAKEKKPTKKKSKA